MDLHPLKAFLAVAEELYFRRAARRLLCSQVCIPPGRTVPVSPRPHLIGGGYRLLRRSVFATRFATVL